MDGLVVETHVKAMWRSDPAETGCGRYELCFRPLFGASHGFRFPCDRHGQVNLDSLSHRARNNYLYARAMVGRELHIAVVEALKHGGVAGA